MNMIRINPSSAANLTMGHHLLDLCGRYMEIWAKTSNQTAPHGTHFWAPLQQRERESQDFADGNCKGCKGCKGCQDSENMWKLVNFPKWTYRKTFTFLHEISGRCLQILPHTNSGKFIWISIVFESNTPKTIGLMPPFIGETLAQCPPRSDFKSHAAIFSITWIQSSLTHLILAAKLGGFKETNLLAAQPAVPWSASNVSNFPCSKTGDLVSPHCDAALKNLQIPSP